MPKKGKKNLLAGKLPIRLLDSLLKRYAASTSRKGVLIGPSIGIDSTVIDFSAGYGKYLIAKTDPITFVSEDIGLYALHINANDIAVMGGVPRWFLATILLPEGNATKDLVERIFSQLSKACKDLDVSLCGGHTEVTYGITRPIVVGQMLGRVDKKNLCSSDGARRGDELILTKGIPIEGGSVMARVKGKELMKVFPKSLIDRCKNLIKDPGISVLKDARIAQKSGRVHAMHDPTEGGLSMGLYELAVASNVGVEVERETIPIIEEAGRLARYFNLDPMGVIASGALVLSVDPRDTKNIIKSLKYNGINSVCIGRITDRRQGIKIIENGKKKPLRIYERDEITKIF